MKKEREHGKGKKGRNSKNSKNSKNSQDKGKPFRKRRKKPCIFCKEQRSADYKDTAFMARFISDRGKILPRRNTGCCSKHQAMIAKLVKRSRHVGLLPFVVE